MIISTPIDYEYLPDKTAEKILRIIQERERRFTPTYTSDIYREYYGIGNGKRSNEITHEPIDNAISRLEKLNFIEKSKNERDRRRIQIITKPDEIYTEMINTNPKKFWELIDKEYFYFLDVYMERYGYVECPECNSKGKLETDITGIKTARYRIGEEIAINVRVRHLSIHFRCDCGFEYSNELDMVDPMAFEDLVNLLKAGRRNLG